MGVGGVAVLLLATGIVLIYYHWPTQTKSLVSQVDLHNNIDQSEL